MLKQKPANDALREIGLRFLMYTLAMFAFTLSLPAVLKHLGYVFSENGPLEWLQLAVIAASFALFQKESLGRKSEFKDLFQMFALVMACLATRELDMLFDRFIPIFGWQLPATLLVFLLGLKWHKSNRKILAQADAFVHTRSFGLLWCGFIVAVPFAQLVGHGDFLELLMGENYLNYYKRVIEELGELMGYLLIAFGAVEATMLSRYCDKQPN